MLNGNTAQNVMNERNGGYSNGHAASASDTSELICGGSAEDERGRRPSLGSEADSDLKDSIIDQSITSERQRRGSLSRSSLSGSASSGLNLMGLGGGSTLKRESTLEALEKKRRENISGRLKDLQSTLLKKELAGGLPPSPSNLPVIVGVRSRLIPRLQSTRRQRQQLTQRSNSYDQVKANAFTTSELSTPSQSPGFAPSSSGQEAFGYGRSESVNPGTLAYQFRDQNGSDPVNGLRGRDRLELYHNPSTTEQVSQQGFLGLPATGSRAESGISNVTASTEFFSTPTTIQPPQPPPQEFTDIPHLHNTYPYDKISTELKSADEETVQTDQVCLQTTSNQSGVNDRQCLDGSSYKTAIDICGNKTATHFVNQDSVRFESGASGADGSPTTGPLSNEASRYIDTNKSSSFELANMDVRSLPNASSSTENVTRWLKHQSEEPILSQYIQNNISTDANNISKNLFNSREGESGHLLRSYAGLNNANEMNTFSSDRVTTDRRLYQSSSAECLNDDNECNRPFQTGLNQAINQTTQKNVVNATNEKENQNYLHSSGRESCKTSAKQYLASIAASDKYNSPATESNLLRPPAHSGSRQSHTRSPQEFGASSNYSELNTSSDDRLNFTNANNNVSFSRGISMDNRSLHSSRSPSPGSVMGIQCRDAQELMRAYGASTSNTSGEEYQARPRASTTIHTSRVDFTPSRCRKTRDLRDMSQSPTPSSQRSLSIDRMTSVGDRMTSMGDRMTSMGDRMTSVGDRMTSVGDRMTSVGVPFSRMSQSSQSNFSASVGDSLRGRQQDNSTSLADNFGYQQSTLNASNLHQKSQSEIIATQRGDFNVGKQGMDLSWNHSKDIPQNRVATDHGTGNRRIRMTSGSEIQQVQDPMPTSDNWSKDIRTRLEEMRKRVNLTGNNEASAMGVQRVNTGDDLQAAGTHSRRELVNRLGRERDRRSNSVSSCFSGELKLSNGNEIYNFNQNVISSQSGNDSCNSAASIDAASSRTCDTSDRRLSVSSSAIPDVNSVRAKMFSIISSIPTYGQTQTRVPVRSLATRQNPTNEGTPVRIEGQGRMTLEGTPVRVEVVQGSSDIASSIHQDGNGSPGRTSNGTECLPSVDRTWETYPQSHQSAKQRICIPTVGSTNNQHLPQNKDSCVGNYQEMGVRNFSDGAVYGGIESDAPSSEVMEVIIQKSGLGLGFCIEGGKNSAGGDRPITVKRLFHGFRGASVESGALRPHVGRSLPDGGSLRPGDELIAAEGYQLEELSHYSAWNFLKTLPDGPVRLLVRRKTN